MATETTSEREAADRRGVDGLTRRIVEHGKETGREVRHDDARRQAATIAERCNRERRR
jgi:hypothetical protein